MYKKILFILFVLLLSYLGWYYLLEEKRLIDEDNNSSLFVDENCLEQFELMSENDFFRTMNVDDIAAVERLKSVNPPSDGQLISGFENEKINNALLVWHSDDGKQAFVNAEFFSDVNRIHLTRLDSRREVGIAKAALLAEWNAKRIFQFLIRSNILSSYIHTDAELCLTDVDDNEETYEERYDAVHSYYTNQKNQDDYQFLIQIDKKTGLISVAPSQRP
jgi:hypothetical protein